MDREKAEDTCIEYVTTNVLVEKIIHTKTIEPYTHIIVDEIHERHQDLDCLLFLLRRLDGSWGKSPKIILMSATAESDMYAKYFGENICRRVSIEGSVYDVERLYLENIPTEICNKIQTFAAGRRVRQNGEEAANLINKALVLHADVMKAVGDLIETFDARDCNGVRGAVLVFLPGTAEINQMIRILGKRKDTCRFELIPLHSRVPLEDQNRAFKRVPPSIRKIIVATNIAESSITVRDIRYVIDFCLTKNQVVDEHTNFASYQIEFCSKANCEQRAGRAGRVQNGIVFRLVSRKEYEAFNEFPIPEMLRCPVDISVLKIKTLGLERPKEVLREFIDPPKVEDVARAIMTLKEVQAMQLEHNGKVDVDDGNLTILGKVMAKLPLDIHLSKLILMGFAFGCFEECIKIAACLSVDDIILPYDDALQNYRNKLHWADGSFSDPLMLMHAFDAFLEKKDKDSSDDIRAANDWARSQGLQFRRLLEAFHVHEDLKQRLSQIGFSEPQTPNLTKRDDSLQNFFVMMALCGAFYPFYYALNPLSRRSIANEFGDHDPTNTMIISGFPEGHGPLYAQAIRAALEECLMHNEVQLSFHSIDAYLTFENDRHDGTPLDAYLCELYRRRREGITVPKIPPERARRLLAQRGITVDERVPGPPIKVLPVSQRVVDRMKKAPLPTDRSIKGKITGFTNILTFYMILDERMQRLREVHSEIENELSTNRDGLDRREIAPEPGTFVLAELEDSFCRAQVVGEASQHVGPFYRGAGIPVFFIDYGNTAVVSYVYLLPETMLISSGEAPFAYKAQLAHVKTPDGVIGNPTTEQMLSKNKECRAEVYSIVDDTLRVTLFLEIDDEEVNLNEKLVYDNLLIQDQEPDFSQRRAASDLMQHLVLRGEEFVDINQYGLGEYKLNGPRTPLSGSWELLRPLSRGSADKQVEVTPQSINNVMFGSTSNYQQFVVGHMTKLSADRKRVQLLQSTLMTKLPMMLPFVALVFSPRAEYRRNGDNTKFVSAVCGMGGMKSESGRYEAVSGNTDVEVPFSQELGRTDVKIINEIRRLLNEAFCGNNDVYEWTSVPILKIQKKIEDFTLRFFNINDRKPIDRDYEEKKKRRTLVAPPKWTEIANANHYIRNPAGEKQILFRPHPIYQILDATTVEVLKLLQSFTISIEKEREIRLTLCPICCETFVCNSDALTHLQTTEHRLRKAKLRGDE